MYVGEITLGMLFLSYSIEAFLIYLLFVLIFLFERIRKLMRFYNLTTEIKILSLVKKLEVTEEEIKQILGEQLDKLSDKEKKSLEKDLNIL